MFQALHFRSAYQLRTVTPAPEDMTPSGLYRHTHVGAHAHKNTHVMLNKNIKHVKRPISCFLNV